MNAPSSQDLSPEDQRKIKDWLASKGITATCPACKQDKLIPDSKMACAPLFSFASGMTTAALLPVVLVYCENCGYEMLFNAVVMGLAPLPPDKSKGEVP